MPGPHRVTGHTGPLIPGHELSGRVVEIGPGVEGFEIGAVVTCGAGYTIDTDEEVQRGRPEPVVRTTRRSACSATAGSRSG